MKILKCCLIAICLVVLAGPAVWAQETSALRGTVRDPSGAVVPGAEVVLTDTNTGASRTARTDGAGNYRFPQVLPGRYSLRVSFPGFKTAVRTEVILQVATTTNLDIPLELGQVAESIEVDAAVVPTINVVDASVGHVFGESQIKQLPSQARNPVGLLAL